MKLFGTNGIRGIANEYLECNMLVKIGMSIAKVLVGYDQIRYTDDYE